jgi:TolA-binding protein
MLGMTVQTQATPGRLAANHLVPNSAHKPRVEPQSALPSQLLAPPAVHSPLLPTPGEVAPVAASAAPLGEHALIAAALYGLRTSHKAETALETLDEYRRRFPSGALAPEADRLRAEALLLLGRKATLRDELDRSMSRETPANDERVVLRGELRAATGRWQAALADFDAVVRAHSTGAGTAANDRRARERIERALWGRASARSHVGDDAGARADLREYLRRFPDGRFAAEVSRLLEEQP